MANRTAPDVPEETFRTRLLVRGVVLGADTLWVAVLAALIVHRGGAQDHFSALFFIALFSACAFFYERLAFTVSGSGLTVRSLSVVEHIAFEDILRVDVLPGLVGTSYAVRTRRGRLRFSSLLAGHERLCRRLIDAARLSARR
jgi:hypothetical protein